MTATTVKSFVSKANGSCVTSKAVNSVLACINNFPNNKPTILFVSFKVLQID